MPIPYSYGYKTRVFFPFQNNPKNLDLSYKTDLDFWDCLGRVKLILKFQRTDLVICSHSRERKTKWLYCSKYVFHMQFNSLTTK